MREDRQTRRGSGQNGRWPEYLEPLRPDEVTHHRLRRQITQAAETLLAIRTRSWYEVTATWSAVLAPVAATLLIVFGALAYRASAGPEPEQLAAEPADQRELLHSLADTDSPPALLIGAEEPSRDAILSAALVSSR